jgi:prephenate dehydratase
MTNTKPADVSNIIAFQGEPGANSQMACHEACPGLDTLACPTFEEAFAAVKQGRAGLAMIPVENSVSGRVADIHHLLPESGLYINGEHFFRVHHQLLAPRGATLQGLKTVRSQLPALGQCRNIIQELKLTQIAAADTAGSARQVAEAGDRSAAALASSLAAEIYGLDILRANVEDLDHNTTRFLIMSATPQEPAAGSGALITSFVFQVRNVPAALYKAMGGFATNGVNMTKLESYQLGGSFNATQFYADIEGHPSSRAVRLAFEELEFFSTHMKILGVYPAHPYRKGKG